MTPAGEHTSTTSDDIRILDSRGCLTLEAMCFTGQLGPDQQAVVERHIRTCGICAQQHADLARATERMRSARPRVPVPSEIKLLAREVALKGLAMRRTRQGSKKKQRSTARIRVIRRPVRWYQTRAFWAAVLFGMCAALILALVALLLATV
jgi:anti-sigma factor RsiW